MNSILIEKLSAEQHKIWAHWMVYLFDISTENRDGTVTISADKVERWKRQMKTDYANLSFKEQNSDREQAHKIMKVIIPFLNRGSYIP